MDEKRALLRHFLAALAYRTQKALRDAPASYPAHRAARGVRTPHQILAHMDSVLGYALTFFEGGAYRNEPLADFDAEVRRFHGKLERLAHHLEAGTPFGGTTPEAMLQGLPPENFIVADLRPENLGPHQPPPVSPDEVWRDAPD